MAIKKIRSYVNGIYSFNSMYIFLLLIFSLLFFYNIISATRIMDNVHYINDVTFYSYNMKESLKRHTLPLWTPYYYSGRPLFAQPEYYFVDLNFLLVWLTGDIYLSMNLSVIFYLFLAGLGMYFLAFYLLQSRRAAVTSTDATTNTDADKDTKAVPSAAPSAPTAPTALAASISAFMYMFNGYVHTFVMTGNIMILEGYSLIPLIFLFTVKALKEKEFVLNSVIAGIFASLLIFAGGVIFLPYIFLLIAVYSAVYITNKNISNILNRILKLSIVGILILAVCFGLSAIKLLPGIEFMRLSNRGAGLPYQEFVGAPIKLNNFGFTFITNTFLQGDNISAAIGIAGFALLIFGLLRLKNKTVLFSIFIVLLSLVMSSESFITKIMYSIPIINQTRHIERSIFLFAFVSPILAGLGFINLQSFLQPLIEKYKNEKYKKIYKKIAKNSIFFVIFSLLFLELFLLQKMPQAVAVVSPSDIPILSYMDNDKSVFRTMNLALSTLIGASGYNYYSQFGISEIKGGSGIWFNDYLNYLAVAHNAPNAQAKLWGILNNKYVIMNQNISIDGLSYIRKFEVCKQCQIWEASGPYLYLNTKFLPRYYVAPNSIFVVGDTSSVKQVIYALMLHNFEPKNTVIIKGTRIDDYSLEFLNRFNAVILTSGSVEQNSVDNSIGKLKEYSSQGGIIIPNILSGQNSISDDDIKRLFDGMKRADGIGGDYKQFKESRIRYYSNNKAAINLDGEKGWLVASERFAYFPGWKAGIGGSSAEIFEADNVVSAVYLNGEMGELIFEYQPNSYKIGRLISIVAVFLIITNLFLLTKKKLDQKE